MSSGSGRWGLEPSRLPTLKRQAEPLWSKYSNITVTTLIEQSIAQLYIASAASADVHHDMGI